jgi:hypothetical protein
MLFTHIFWLSCLIFCLFIVLIIGGWQALDLMPSDWCRVDGTLRQLAWVDEIQVIDYVVVCRCGTRCWHSLLARLYRQL